MASSAGGAFPLTRNLLVHRIANDRASHAMSTSPATSQFRADYSDDFHALFAKERITIRITVVAKDDTGRDRDIVVTAAAVLSLGPISISSGTTRPQLFQA